MFLTSTMQVGRVYDAACRLLMEEEPAIGVQDVIIPVVAECADSFLNEARAMQITIEEVRGALRAAREWSAAQRPRRRWFENDHRTVERRDRRAAVPCLGRWWPMWGARRSGGAA